MANLRGSFHRIAAILLAIGATLGALYGIALLATAVTGSNSPSSVLLGGFGFILLLVSLVLFSVAIRRWKTSSSGQDS